MHIHRTIWLQMDSEDKIHYHLEVASKCDDDVLLKNEQEFKSIYLPISLLKAITNNFSDGLQIGSGGFVVVYKKFAPARSINHCWCKNSFSCCQGKCCYLWPQGLLKRGGTVAVKKLLNTICMDDNQFQKDCSCLMRVRHKNIVRFLGYSADTQGKM